MEIKNFTIGKERDMDAKFAEFGRTLALTRVAGIAFPQTALAAQPPPKRDHGAATGVHKPILSETPSRA
jgi:hypothetical protein